MKEKSIILLFCLLCLLLGSITLVLFKSKEEQVLNINVVDDVTLEINKHNYSYEDYKVLSFKRYFKKMIVCGDSGLKTKDIRKFFEKTHVYQGGITYLSLETEKRSIPCVYGVFNTNSLHYVDVSVVETIRVTNKGYIFSGNTYAYDNLDDICLITPCVLQIVCNYDSMYIDFIRLLDFVAENNNIKEIYIIMNG